DVVLANDFSGSMEWCANTGCPFVLGFPRRICGTGPFFFPFLGGALCNYTSENYFLPGYGNVCSARWQAKCPVNDTKKIDIAINASRAFTTILLGSLGNKLGVVGYTDGNNFVKNMSGPGTFTLFNQGIVRAINLTSNAVDVDNFITTHMDTYWETCICCGVEASMQNIGNHSSPGRYKSIVVMSDGEANRRCYTTAGTATGDAIAAAQMACNVHNISVNSVAFGSAADTATLKAMACNNGSFYNATNVSQLISAFTEIANQINTVSYTTQAVNLSGGLPGASLLFGDSYIEYNYTPNVLAQFGVIPATFETPRFGNNISQATFTLPSGTTLYQLKVTSYSSDKWTDNLTISNSVPLSQAFSLQQFGSNYNVLGDPFVVYAKSSLFETGDNVVKASTATSPGNYSGGSPDNLMIYTLLVPNSVPNGDAFGKADGCVWQVTFEDGTNATVPIPGSYSGPEVCYFDPPSFTVDDAVDDATYRLLKHLDFDGDNLLDIKFQADDLGVGIVT
ncbi:MAG TPA: vWA domain-containing protein, partial [Methylophilaceae bacterium]|nr:vWA domain-containing protein [Methylophilaceae bacterium]